jgi:hypothetical protein
MERSVLVTAEIEHEHEQERATRFATASGKRGLRQNAVFTGARPADSPELCCSLTSRLPPLFKDSVGEFFNRKRIPPSCFLQRESDRIFDGCLFLKDRKTAPIHQASFFVPQVVVRWFSLVVAYVFVARFRVDQVVGRLGVKVVLNQGRQNQSYFFKHNLRGISSL